MSETASFVDCPACSTRLLPQSGSLKFGVYTGVCTVCGQRIRFRSAGVTENPVNAVTFFVNGVLYALEDVDPVVTLSDWLKEQAGLKGTKYMCQEGGCGACVVTLTRNDVRLQRQVTMAVNSCLFPLVAADGCSVTTTDGIGSSRSGFHPIQERLAEHNGSQCGFCSPGMVMNMYSLLKENSKPTKQQIEDSFDGNLCRCTGYRAILDAMKSFAVDENPIDIEESATHMVCSKDCQSCSHTSSCCKGRQLTGAKVNGVTTVGCVHNSSGVTRFKPSSVQDALALLNKYKEFGAGIVAGDTGKAVMKHKKQAPYLIDVMGIPDLYIVSSDGKFVTVGSAVSLSDLISVLEKFQQQNMSKGMQLGKLAQHLKLIANVPVRNVGTWAGNLMLPHIHANFPSDGCTIMQAAGAVLNIVGSNGLQKYTLQEFLQIDMTGKIITSIVIPFDEPNEHFLTFKIMPRHVNAHAYVNAGFRLVTTTPTSKTVGNTVVIVYRGIGPHTTEALNTEKYLIGKDLTKQTTLSGALSILSSEINPDSPTAAASAAYRKSLALSLFYKFYLSVLGSAASSRLLSAPSTIYRPVSSGTQQYSSDPSRYPLTKPMTKLAAKLQASGEAEYVNDIPLYPNEVHGAFIISTQANAKLISVDTSAALSMPGVLCCIGAEDIPPGGINNWCAHGVPEPVFATDYIGFAGQSIGMVIADTQTHADAAALAVTAKYSQEKKPILTIKDAIAANSLYPHTAPPLISGEGDPVVALKASKHVISGEISCGHQYHFHMETQRCLTVPTDCGLDVYSSTQWMDYCQETVAQVLGLKKSSVNVSVKRIGGGFGGKIRNSHLIAAGASLAAYKLNRPVRVVLTLDTNTQMVGDRRSWLAQYQVGFDDSGKLNAIVMTAYCDSGFTENGSSSAVQRFIDNAYYSPHWKVSVHSCKTDTPSNTSCRSPGSLPATFIMESIMEHVAKSLDKSPEDVRMVNLYQKGQVTPLKQPLLYCNISSLWSQLIKSSNFEIRQTEVNAFNKANRWKKKGLSIVPLKFGVAWSGALFNCLLSVYAGDGSVMVTTGGIEMGQGLITKVVQVVASTLRIDIDLIKTRPSNVLTAPNNEVTGGSIGSELSCAAALSACQQLLEQMQPAREKLPSNATWLQVVTMCSKMGIDLQAKGRVDKTTQYTFQYFSYGVTCTEVEVDVLTGEHEIIRSDILYDCGESMNPEIDVGQAEGGFVMGLGYWLSEHFIRDPKTGQLLTTNTWEYNPPSAHDIPIDFRISLLKNAPNPLGILRSKAVGEPPTCMSCSALFAIKHAIENALSEISQDTFFPLNGPATVDKVQTHCQVYVLVLLMKWDPGGEEMCYIDRTVPSEAKTIPQANRWKKKGLSVVPLKYPVAWSRSGISYSCILSVFVDDGSVMVTTGGIEMGQGLITKVVQVIASTLRIDIDLIKTRPSNVLTAPNSASIGSELNCAAALSACHQLLEKMKPAREILPKHATWRQIVKMCSKMGIELQAKGWVDKMTQYPYQYFTYGVTCTEVEVDVLTGEHEIIRSDILYDCGESMNPEIDVGQAEGGVSLLKNAPNPLGILRSKAIGEPPTCMSCSALFAIKHAIENALSEISQDTFFPLNGPATVDKVQTHCQVKSDQFTV